MRHSPLSRALLLSSLVPAIVGLMLGNAALLLLGGMVFLVVVRAREGADGAAAVGFEMPASRVQRGVSVEARLTASMEESPFVGLAHQGLDETFHLERGENVHLFTPGRTLDVRFSFVAPRRGHYRLEPPTIERVHPLSLAPSKLLAQGQPMELTVDPLVRPLRSVKGLRGPARDRIGEDKAVRGPRSTEFQELRTYVRGDPLKIVNWKATAKRSIDDLSLMVNQYEPEARKNVWFFLDTDASLEVGTTLNTALDDAIDITLALVHHFTSRGHRVGGCTYNGHPLIFYPDSGSRQELIIARALAKVTPGDEHEGLSAAAERVKGFLVRERPMVFVVTRPEVATDGLLAGARRVYQHATTARRTTPITVLAPDPPSAGENDDLARALTALEAKQVVATRAGPLLRVHRLAGGARGLERALARGVLAR